MEETAETSAMEGYSAPDETKVCQTRVSETKRYSEIFRDFDNLELSLIHATVEEMIPDPDTQSIAETVSTETTDNMDQDEMMSEDGYCPEFRTDGDHKETSLTAQDADLVLCRSEGGVELALQYAKMWCRYAKDLLNWMDKRMSLEQEFAKNIMKAAETAKSCVTQQDMMPLQYIYTMALEQDMKSSTVSRQTGELLQQRCFQALAAKKNEIDKWRREFKDQWTREQRKMNEVVSALKKARQLYTQRCEELEKAKALRAKAEEDVGGYKTLDKRRKSRDEAQCKMKEAEILYKQCVSEANTHREELEKVKERIIVHTRKLIFQGDTVLKEATVNMFFYQRQQTEPVPLGYHNLELTCRPCEPGEPYLLYVLRRRCPEQLLQNFTFQEYTPLSKRSPPGGRRKTINPISSMQDSYPLPDDALVKRPGKTGYSDSESMGGSLESLSSPAHGSRKLPKAPSIGTMSSDDLDEKDTGTLFEADVADPVSEGNGIIGSVSKVRTPSRAALTHKLKKIKSKMSKCRQCENYILVNGVECEECGLAVHRKCLDVWPVECDHRKGVLFGVDFSRLPRDRPEEVPFLVHRCTTEIESRALAVQGVYRVSGSKPRIQKLCQAFETQGDQVDLSDISPHDLTSVLKHFFKELAEPLMTFDLYNELMAVGKNIQRLYEKEPAVDEPETVENIVHNLREVFQKLPPYNYSTLQHMIKHLHRISEHYEDNKMSPGNLGIVFGPTLMRPLVSGDMSMIALLETSYQAQLVEFLITHHTQVFCLTPRLSTPPPPPPTAPLPETPNRKPCPLSGENSTLQNPKASDQERPRSLENHKIKRDSSEGYISDKSSSNEAVDQLSSETNERAVLAVRVGAGDPLPGTVAVRQMGQCPPLGTSQHTSCAVALSCAVGGGAQSEDSWSSSPEISILRQTRPRLEITPETARLLRKAGHTPSIQPSCQSHSAAADLEPGLGIQSSPAAPGSNQRPEHAETVELNDEVDPLATLNNNQSNSGSGDRGRGLSRSFKRHPGEERTAHKILSGLKLKRSNTGKGEEVHFV